MEHRKFRRQGGLTTTGRADQRDKRCKLSAYLPDEAALESLRPGNCINTLSCHADVMYATIIEAQGSGMTVPSDILAKTKQVERIFRSTFFVGTAGSIDNEKNCAIMSYGCYVRGYY